MEMGVVVEENKTVPEVERVEPAPGGTRRPGVSPPGTRTLRSDDRPQPEWVRGRCPECGDDLVSNLYYIGGKGYLLTWECWSSLGEAPRCHYRKVL